MKEEYWNDIVKTCKQINIKLYIQLRLYINSISSKHRYKILNIMSKDIFISNFINYLLDKNFSL